MQISIFRAIFLCTVNLYLQTTFPYWQRKRTGGSTNLWCLLKITIWQNLVLVALDTFEVVSPVNHESVVLLFAPKMLNQHRWISFFR